MKWSKVIFLIIAAFIGIGLYKTSLDISKEDLPVIGRRLIPIKRYYPLRVSLTLILITALLDFWVITKLVPVGYEWLSVIILAFAFSAISTFFPFKQRARNK